MIARVLRVAGRREDKACVVQRSLVGRGHERAGTQPVRSDPHKGVTSRSAQNRTL